jgi:hypothetical protein
MFVSLFPQGACHRAASDVCWTPHMTLHKSVGEFEIANFCMCALSVPLVLFPSLFLYYHPALGCQLVHERFAQHEILHVDRINQKEEIKVGFAPKWFALRTVCCNVTCLFYCPPSITHALSRTGNRIKTKEHWQTMLDTRSLISTHAHIYTSGRQTWPLLFAAYVCVLCLCPPLLSKHSANKLINVIHQQPSVDPRRLCHPLLFLLTRAAAPLQKMQSESVFDLEFEHATTLFFSGLRTKIPKTGCSL